MQPDTDTLPFEGELYSFEDYLALVDERIVQHGHTGMENKPILVDFTRRNRPRVQGIYEDFAPLDETDEAFSQIQRPQVWTVLGESWCTNVASSLPVIARLAELNPGQITFRVGLRDQNPAVMDQFLTNGGKAIPKLIIQDAETGAVLADWGPRPAELQALTGKLKEEQADFKRQVSESLAWYDANGGRAAEAEITAIVQKLG